MKVAIVHDWLYTYAGAEKVLERIINCFSEADLFSLIDFLPENKRDFIQNKPVKTSFIQKMPFARTKHRHYLPLMPLAIEQLDLRSYDLVISSSHAVAKGILTSPHQLHICYCHSPIRYAWDMQHQYLEEANLTRGVKSWLTRYLLHKIRLWDYRTANGVDYFIANSKFIASRIWKTYRREAQVIYPPVDISKFALYEGVREDYYLTASRFVPYKKIVLIAESFKAMPERKLKIVGTGPDASKIKEIANSSTNIEYLGFVEDDELISLMRKARAFVFAAEEDFGIIPVEAQACGTPVIAYKRGGSAETVIDAPVSSRSGVFFTEQSVNAIVDALARFEELPEIEPAICRANAEQFSVARFCSEFKDFVHSKYDEFLSGKS
ncbi:glycosyltransferase family 4 protein [Aquella oligotrophica]|uniref:Glycosyl transferase family 1 n=1 Tax=Aquella oligotrophica TaxID=2067065 RepID=A0A2I7N572_9NEIS|nr:glycosyltransferase family 4 protein [Aquella oligotrophica]AUR51600.1 glycosyl transferase family 1 [Aquella oligotrophica]